MLIKNKLHWVVRKYLEQAGENGDPGGGAAPAPAPAPAAAGPQGVEGGGVDWEGLNDGVNPGNDDGEHDDGDGLHVEAGVPPQGEGQPAQPPVATNPPANPDEPGAPEVPPEGDQETDLQADPDAPQPLTPEQQEAARAQYQEWRTAEEARIEANYQFSEDEVVALQTEPEKVLPKMAAKLFMDVQEAAVRSVVQMLPQIVGRVNQTQSRDAQASQVFVAANPDLADKKYHADIMDAARTFRKRNPKATPQEAIKKIGQMVRAMHGLEAPVPGTPAPAPAPAARRPAAPPTPHKPAAAGAAPARAPAPKGDNVWANLLDDDD